MISYKYNETAYAELVLNSGFQTKHILTELKLLVLYLRDILNLKPKKREEFLIEFCKKYIPNFKKEKYYKLINQSLRYAKNKSNKLIDITEISVYQGEIEYINSLDINYDYKKIMFTFMVQLKLNKFIYEYRNNKEYTNIYFRGDKKKYSNIRKISNISSKISIHDDVINELNRLGLIKILHKGMIILEYLNNCKKDGDITIKIKDFDNIGLYFDLYNNIKGIIKCNKCKNPVKQTNNKMKYCSECAKGINIQKTIENRRNKNCLK